MPLFANRPGPLTPPTGNATPPTSCANCLLIGSLSLTDQQPSRETLTAGSKPAGGHARASSRAQCARPRPGGSSAPLQAAYVVGWQRIMASERAGRGERAEYIDIVV